MRHLTWHSEASKPAQIDTEPSLFIFQTSPSSLIPAFLAFSLLWQGVYPKLEGEKEVSRKMSKFIYCGQKALKMPTVDRATRKSGACAIISVYIPLLMLPLWAPLLPSRAKSSPNIHLLWAHVVIMCSFSEDLEGQRKARKQFKTGMMGTLMLCSIDFIYHILIVWPGDLVFSSRFNLQRRIIEKVSLHSDCVVSSVIQCSIGSVWSICSSVCACI